MLSHLELVTRDVLEHIAFLVALSPDFTPPQDLLSLLLTSSTIYNSLSTTSAPHLYSRLFRRIFDFAAVRRNSEGQLIDSRLTTELISRCRLLRRVQRHDLSEDTMHEDLCSALRIILESDGINESHLRAANFLQFIMDYVQQRLKENDVHTGNVDLDLALWLFVLTLSRADVTEIPEEVRGELIALLRPTIASIFKISTVATHSQSSLEAAISRHVHYQEFAMENSGVLARSLHHSSCPSASSAALLLTLVLEEADNVQVPAHLSVDRPASQPIEPGSSGPTIEDYCNMANYKTALFALDHPTIRSTSQTEIACGELARSAIHDPEFHQGPTNHVVPGSIAYDYIPGFLTGVWEGIYMVFSQAPACKVDDSGNGPINTPDFVCKKPMQCSLSVYFCCNPCATAIPECLAKDVCDWIVSPSQFADIQDHLAVCEEEVPYERFVPTKSGCESMSRQVVDCIIIGQTLHEHEQAWGGFKFAGRLKRDGLIVLKREPRNEMDANFGTWIFEGHVRYGAAFVGTWRSSRTHAQSGAQGIFSMGKKQT